MSTYHFIFLHAKLAKESNIAYSSLYNIFNRQTCPTIVTLEKICKGFNISLSEFFSFETNLLRNESLTFEQQDLLNTYDELSAQDKLLLQSIFKGIMQKIGDCFQINGFSRLFYFTILNLSILEIFHTLRGKSPNIAVLFCVAKIVDFSKFVHFSAQTYQKLLGVYLTVTMTTIFSASSIR